ncbi:glycosyltransferase family 4 protein [Notoacmeibacter ruber]|uniref:Glycosyltransferase WbuB n=1 Tax=Notoacmeibacter ruber TaxID=2670375 RepID=A0A3L7J9U2_9HYPH|nr:glycosyltransferase family 4 protein [Notoacmeibacter ruber]RLQ87386.1 glycosyltransferase WbuB [Notoacmeibacter ruber]
MIDSPTERPRLIFLTQFYDPEPAYKGQAFAEAVREMGYDVEVVTGFPNYPGGRLYDGYRIWPWQRSVENGIRITRLAMYPSHNAGKVGRIANYLSFFCSAFLYLCFAARRANLIYVYHPPLTVGLAAAASRWLHGRPVIVDIHDLWPDTLPATGMISSPRILRWIDHAASWMYRNVQFIILHTEGFGTKLLERGVPQEKMKTIIGWCNEHRLPDNPPEGIARLTTAPGLKLLYAGNLGPAQALDSVLGAAEILQRNGQPTLATFCFLGDGVSKDKLEKRAGELGLENVVFLPRVSARDVPAYLDAADALLVHLRDEPLFQITLPSKTQAYLYAGKPIIMAVLGEAACLIERADAGLCIRPEDPEAMAKAVRRLAHMSSDEREAMGERGRVYYERELSMERGLRQFSEIFDRITQLSTFDYRHGRD